MKIVVYHRRAREYCSLLRERFPELEIAGGSEADSLSQHMASADIVLCFDFPHILLKEGKQLRWIQLTSAGVEQLLEDRESLEGIVVTNTRGMHADIIADYALGAIVILQWRFLDLFADKNAKRWGQWATEPLSGKTLGILGMGAIGCEIGRRARSCGMAVMGLKRHPVEVEGVNRVFGPHQLREMLPLCDFVVVALPMTSETFHMIGEKEFRAMKEKSSIINISRGSIVNELSLIKALREKWIGGAFLDVFEKEPLPSDSPLWTFPNIMITPHIAGMLQDYPARVIDIFGDNLRRWVAGLPLQNQVDLARGY